MANQRASIFRFALKEGLTLEMSTQESLYGGQLTSLTQSIKLNYLVIHPSRHSFTVSVETYPLYSI